MSKVQCETVDVAFVVDLQDVTREVVAVMPAMAATVGRPDHCTCYVHNGQHSACDIFAIRHFYRDATRAEYTDLKIELHGIGYDNTKVVSLDCIDSADYFAKRRLELGL